MRERTDPPVGKFPAMSELMESQLSSCLGARRRGVVTPALLLLPNADLAGDADPFLARDVDRTGSNFGRDKLRGRCAVIKFGPLGFVRGRELETRPRTDESEAAPSSEQTLRAGVLERLRDGVVQRLREGVLEQLRLNSFGTVGPRDLALVTCGL